MSLIPSAFSAATMFEPIMPAPPVTMIMLITLTCGLLADSGPYKGGWQACR
jgi:hypothetical protein